MRRSKWTVGTLAIAAAMAMLSTGIALAQQGGKGGGNGGGGGGGSRSAYTIIPLPSPGGDGSHYGVLKSISDLGPAGEVHVVGYHYYSSDDRPYCWTVDAAGNVEIEDLNAWFWARADLDVNSAGVICGGTNTQDKSPAVLFPDGTFVVLQAAYSSVRLNNPDEHGTFQVVGGLVMWDIASDGTILATTPLVDASGTQLHAYDVNDFEEIAGFIYVDNDTSQEQIPAMGSFVGGQLQISTRINPSPDVIIGFSDIQIDNGGNLLGFGVQPAPLGFYPRAVVWPASGGSIDLVKEFPNLNTAHGNGIATVDGVLQVVGDAHANSGTFPYFYANAELSDLNGLSKGDEPWEIQGADGINHAGMICGHGRVGRRGNYRAEACLLVPTNK